MHAPSTARYTCLRDARKVLVVDFFVERKDDPQQIYTPGSTEDEKHHVAPLQVGPECFENVAEKQQREKNALQTTIREASGQEKQGHVAQHAALLTTYALTEHIRTNLDQGMLGAPTCPPSTGRKTTVVLRPVVAPASIARQKFG